jgi:hypothetical protein
MQGFQGCHYMVTFTVKIITMHIGLFSQHKPEARYMTPDWRPVEFINGLEGRGMHDVYCDESFEGVSYWQL